MDYDNDHTLDDFEQELGTDNYVAGTNSNLLNFSARVIHVWKFYDLFLPWPNKLCIFLVIPRLTWVKKKKLLIRQETQANQ